MSARRKSLVVLVALASVTAAVAACTQPTTSAPGGASSAAVPPELQGFYTQQLAWGPCAPFAKDPADGAAFSDPKFDCARLKVPLDYANPTGRSAEIGVLRQKATGEKIGSLLFNPGGPGGSGMEFVTSLAKGGSAAAVAARFDLVGFDPRGVGASTPTLDCLNDAEWAVTRADDDVDPSPAGIAADEQENKEYAQHCAERSGGPDVLANVGTRDVVKDLDILRAVLGDQKLSFAGYSYGTRIGSAYAEAFPQNVRALLLDGALDPKESTIDRTVKQNAGFQQAFEAFAADCAKQQGCPLGTDPAKATRAFQVLSRPLIDHPMQVGDRTLSYSDAVTGTIQALYARDFWPVLARGIAGLATDDGRILLALADLYYRRGQDGVYGNSNEAFIAISCVDEERITDRNVSRELQEKAAQAAPFRDSGRGAVAALDQCAFWPSPPTSKPHVPEAKGLPTTLVVSTTGDPATPYQAGVDLAKALDGKLLTYEGTQHTVSLQGKPCIDDIVNAYLIDLKAPPDNAKCAG